MKKRVAVLMLVVVMTVLALAGCGSKSDAPVVGDWRMSKVETMGVSMDVDEFLAMAGMTGESMDMSIKSNGKFNMNLLGEKADGTWKYEEPTLSLDDGTEVVTATYEDGKITVSYSGVDMFFEKK